MKKVTSALIACLAVAASAGAQQQIQLDSAGYAMIRARAVHLSPHVVLIDSKAHSATLEFSNEGDSVAEADLKLVFAYPVTDEQGHITSPAQPDTAAQSLVHVLQGVPAHVELQPHEKKSVTLSLNKDLPDGEYWTQIVAQRAQVPMTIPAMVNGMPQSVHLNVNLVDNASVWYRKGTMSTGLELSKQRAFVTGDSMLTTCVYMHHTGNAHFTGMVDLTLKNPAGKDTIHAKVPMAVYKDIQPCWNVRVTGMSPGKYTIVMDVTGDRPDIPEAARLPVKPVHLEVPVEIGGNNTSAGK
jgi:hypothetical protein